MAKEPIKEHLRTILKKMFEGTGLEYSDQYVQTDDCYLNHVWKEEEEKAYVDWLADYLYNNVGARKELMKISGKNKEECRRAAQQFASFFGWTTVERKQTQETK